jgi:two-component system NtrC family sensor kinase
VNPDLDNPRVDGAGPDVAPLFDGLFRHATNCVLFIRTDGTVRDVTESRGLQAQLAQAARLAAMGTLVAGVAHEINNPLAGELANQGLALEVVQDVRDRLLGSAPFDRVAEGRRLEEVVEALADAEAGGRRIARIVKDLTTFGRPDPRRTRVRLIEVVDESMRWLAATVTTTANLRVDDHSAPDVIASSGQIEQVLVNLVTNAAKAMPEGKRGEIVVRLGPGSPGMSRLEVIDQGTGMSRTVVDRIFDPFFTTRQVGQGTGLGLAISHAIVTAHGGTLTVQSEVGKGSAFRVELPVAGAEA